MSDFSAPNQPTTAGCTVPVRAALAVGFLALTAATWLAARAQATEYELSLYVATPSSVWIGVGIAFLLSLVIALAVRPGPVRTAAMLLGGGATLTVVALPVLRGYYFYGTADPLTHLGWAKDIASGAMAPVELFYPGLHTLAVVFERTLGYSVRSGLLVALVCLTAVFLLFVPLTVRQITSHPKAVVLAAFAGFLLVPINNISVFIRAHPFSQTLLLSTVVLYATFKYVMSDDTAAATVTPEGICLGFLAVTTVIFHSQLAVHLLALFVAISTLQYIGQRSNGDSDQLSPPNRGRWSHRPLYGHTALLGVAIAVWTMGRSRFRSQIESITIAIQRYIVGNPPDVGGRIGSQGSSVTAIGGSMVELYLKLFLATTVFALLAGFVLLAIWNGRYRSKPDLDAAVRYLVAGCLGTIPLFVLYFAGSVAEMHFRTLGFLSVLVLIVGVIGLSDLHETVAEHFGRKYAVIAVIVLFAVLIPTSIVAIYQSPHIYKANQHVTEAQFRGYGTVFNHSATEANLTSIREVADRYSEGVQGFRNSTEYDRSITGENLTDLRAAADGPLYVPISTYAVEREVRAYHELRYTREQFDAVDEQPRVDRVLSNGDVRLYYTPGSGLES